MSRTVTLSQLRTDIQTKGDFGGATVRHSSTQINRFINQSIQSFRERISDEGSQHYLRSSTGALGVGPTDPYPFYQLDLSGLSPALVRTYGIDVTFSGDRVVSLEHVPFEQRSKYGSRQSGEPIAWSHFRTDQVAIMPPSSSALTYVVWYLPVLSDLSADGDTFDGVAGWEEFIVWDVVCQLIARDQFPQAYQIAEQRRQEVWQNVIRGATKVTQAGGAHTGRDSFGAKLPHFLGSRRPTVAAAGGPVTPVQDSITVGHLAHFAGPAVIGVPSGTTDPIHWHVASLTSHLTQFNSLRQGVVAASDGSASNFLAGDGVWRAPTVAGSVTGVSLSQLANAPPDSILGRYSAGTGAPEWLTPTQVATMLPAFTIAGKGVVPPPETVSGRFLSDDGTWKGAGAPTMLPAGGARAVQYNGGSGFAGETGISITTSPGLSLSFGDTNALAAAGVAASIRTSTGLSIQSRTPSGGRYNVFNWSPSSELLTLGMAEGAIGTGPHSGITTFRSHVATGGSHNWVVGGSGFQARLLQTGMALGNFHLHARSITVFSGIPNDQLSPMASGTVKAQLGADGLPTDVPVATFLSLVPTFTSLFPGTVPASGGGTTNYLRADGTWDAPPGGSATQPSGPASSVQFRGVAGFDGATGISVVASGQAFAFGPSAPAFGTLRFTNGQGLTWQHPNGFGMDALSVASDGVVNVGSPSGTELDLHSSSVVDFNIAGIPLVHRWSAAAYSMGSGTTLTNPQSVKIDGQASSGTVDFLTNSTLRAQVSASGLQLFQPLNFPTGTINVGALALGSGITNALMAPMGSGMVKMRVSATGAPEDISVNTMMAFAPTFTATIPGVVPPSGGGTSNYLRADGTWSTPPDTTASPVGGDTALQFYNAGSFGGATGLNARADGQALGIGVPSFLPAFGDIRVASGFNITANLPSGIAGVAARQSILDWSGGGASGVLKVGGASGILGTHRSEVATGGAFEWLIGGQTGMRLGATALDASRFHIKAKSIDTPSINGLPADANQLKRGLDIGNSSGLPSGLSLYLPRGAASGANRYIIPSGAVGTGTVAAPRFVTLSPTGGRGGAVIRVEKVNEGGWPFEVRTPTGTVLHSFPSGAKGVADFVFSKPSGAVFEHGGSGDLF